MATKNTRFRRIALAAGAALVLPISLAACGGGDDNGDAGRTTAPTQEERETEGKAGPFGPGCASVPKEGSGSFAGMAKDPVATAASHNPALSTLVSAVQKAGLVDTLNNAENITVFAPSNDAFEKMPKADLNKVMNDKEQLTKILTYHVVAQQLTPKELADGEYETLEKSTLTTSGSGESFTVNDSAKVVCGNVETANAKVYIIDTVLMPKS